MFLLFVTTRILMKNRCLVCSDSALVCFVDADVWGPLWRWRYCFKSEVAPIGFRLSHFPHRPGERGKGFVLAAGNCLDVAASRASPSLRVASLSSAIARVLEVRKFAAFSLEFVVALVLLAHLL